MVPSLIPWNCLHSALDPLLWASGLLSCRLQDVQGGGGGGLVAVQKMAKLGGLCPPEVPTHKAPTVKDSDLCRCRCCKTSSTRRQKALQPGALCVLMRAQQAKRHRFM